MAHPSVPRTAWWLKGNPAVSFPPSSVTDISPLACFLLGLAPPPPHVLSSLQHIVRLWHEASEGSFASYGYFLPRSRGQGLSYLSPPHDMLSVSAYSVSSMHCALVTCADLTEGHRSELVCVWCLFPLNLSGLFATRASSASAWRGFSSSSPRD